MAVIEKSTTDVFDVESIKKADLVRARYYSWTEPVNGLVTKVTPEAITVLYLPRIHNACSYFEIYASEVSKGKWALKITGDMENINEVEMTYGEPTDDVGCLD